MATVSYIGDEGLNKQLRVCAGLSADQLLNIILDSIPKEALLDSLLNLIPDEKQHDKMILAAYIVLLKRASQ